MKFNRSMYAIARVGGDVARRFAPVAVLAAVLALATAAIAFPVKTVSGDDPSSVRDGGCGG